MKRKIVSTMLCLTLSAAMILGEGATVLGATANQSVMAAEDAVDATGQKIVAMYSLPDVTGIAYDATTHKVSWNKVKGANRYKLEVYDTSGKEVAYEITSNLYMDLDNVEDYNDNRLQSDVTYTIKVTACNTMEYYTTFTDLTYEAANVVDPATGLTPAQTVDDLSIKTVTNADGSTYELYTGYRYPQSVNAATLTQTFYQKAAEEAYKLSVTGLSGVKKTSVKGSEVTFKVTPATTLHENERIQYEYSNNANFKDNKSDLFSTSYTLDNGEKEFTVDLWDCLAGDVIYVRTRVYNPGYTLTAGQTEKDKYSAYVTTTYKVPTAQMGEVLTNVSGNSIRLNANLKSGNVSGYEYQRLVGKKWVTLAKQKDDYIDKGLKSNTKYTYRVRGYAYNKATKKTTNTSWQRVSAYTWGANLKLKASAESTTSAKLSWSKISKAEGYEIYRVDTSSYSYKYEQGESDDYFDNATLVKTIKKNKTTSYTDKGLTSGKTYEYVVRAYTTVGKNKNYITDDVTVQLGREQDDLIANNSYYTSSGKLVVKWSKKTGIDGYKIEKYNPVTKEYETYKTLKKTATSYTFPKVAAGNDSVRYIVSTYKGSTTYASMSVTVEPRLAAVQDVKASMTADGVKVSWKAVSGADFYRVYRCLKSEAYYDKTTKTYLYNGGDLVYESFYDTSASTNLAALKSEVRGVNKDKIAYFYDPNLEVRYSGELYNDMTSYKTSEITGTSVVDKKVSIQRLVSKTKDPNYNAATDPEYNSNNGWYYGELGEYVKNTDGSLATESVTMVEGPEKGNEYFYFVQAVARPNSGSVGGATEETGSAGFSKPASVVYTSKSAKATSISKIQSTKKDTVKLTLKKASGVKGYAIYRSSSKNGTYVRIATTGSTSFTDSTVTGGKTYYYKVATYVNSESKSYVFSKLSSAKKIKAKK